MVNNQCERAMVRVHLISRVSVLQRNALQQHHKEYDDEDERHGNNTIIAHTKRTTSTYKQQQQQQQQPTNPSNSIRRGRRPPSWSLILSLTAAITFAIGPHLTLGMSIRVSRTTEASQTMAAIAESAIYRSRGGEQQNANVSTMPGEEVQLSAISSYTGGTELVIVDNGMNGSQTRPDNPAGTNGSMADASSPPPHPISLLQGFLASIFCMLIVLTVIGNTLVILSVLTTRRLRTVTNCFVMSLAVADWLVGLFVMPPAVAVFLLDKWQLGRVLCDIWISFDVLLCTASILSLCAISIDRYLAVTQPLVYSRRRRSKRLALLMILVVWVLAVAITCPPMLGWYDSAERGTAEECHYNQNKAYVVYSAMGSFFIPMLVMIYVYVQISCVIAKRHDHMSEIEVHKKGHRSKEADVAEMEIDVDNVSEPEPSSPRRTTRPISTKQEVAATSSGGSNASGCSSNNYNKTFKNAQYELVDGVPHQQQQHPPQIQSQQPKNPNRNMSTYRNSTENWYNSTSSNNNGPVTKTNNIRVHQKSMSNRILSLKRENKTTQTLAIVVGGFIACWLPFFVAYLIAPFLEKNAIDDGVSAFLTWLGWFNSAMNPFIYALYSVDFRAAFWRLTCRRFCKNIRKAPYASNTYSIRRT